jgi:hypothetical protein
MLQILLSLASSWIPLVALALECIQLGLHSSRSSQHAVFHRPKIQKLSVYQTCFHCFHLLFTAACLLLTTTIILKTAVANVIDSDTVNYSFMLYTVPLLLFEVQ